MRNSLISVVIPMHNSENFIAECLDSVFTQTYKNIEVIVVDDDSTDKSAKIVHTYIGKHKNLVYKKVKNGNAALTRRDGINRASADLVCFVDSDDILDVTYVERLYNTMQLTGSSIAACRLEIFKGEFQFVESPKQTPPYVIKSDADAFANHYHITDQNKLTLQTLPCKLFKKELFNNIDYSVLVANIFEDNFIMAQVLRNASTIGVTDSALYWYRQSDHTTSSDTLKTKIQYNGETLNFVEFFQNVVMKYCREMLNGSNVDAAINRVSAVEFYNYARMVPDLVVRKEYLEEKVKLEERKVEGKDAEMRALLESKSYRFGHTVVEPISKILNSLRNGKK